LFVKVAERDDAQVLDDDDAGDADGGLDGEEKKVHGETIAGNYELWVNGYCVKALHMRQLWIDALC
jgi:hypothetical protein